MFLHTSGLHLLECICSFKSFQKLNAEALSNFRESPGIIARVGLIIDSGECNNSCDTRGRTINEPSVYNLALSDGKWQSSQPINRRLDPADVLLLKFFNLRQLCAIPDN